MKIVQINHFPNKAAGSIMMNIHQALQKSGSTSHVVWGRGRSAQKEYEYKMTSNMEVNIHALYTRITDRAGFASVKATKRLIEKLKDINPDIIHLHCVHGYYINIELLFNYIRKKHIKVIWTLHDCWPFTGHCAYFDMAGCDKWKIGCNNCGQLHTYPASQILDASEWNWKKKKELFTGLNLTVVTPCKWLENLVKDSFMKEYPVEVIYNGIDTEIFKPVDNDFKSRNDLENKFLILGVASEWTERKGLNDLVKLSEMLNEQYKIVIVGVTEKQRKSLPVDIIAIKRTNNVDELVQIYSAADVFFNPTYEDNFPTTNLEALACGTQVITYKTGGSSECIVDGINGYVIEKGNLDYVYELIISIKRQGGQNNTSLLDAIRFSKEKMIYRYRELYNV